MDWMASTGTGIAKFPEIGSTLSTESTNNMPWLSSWPLKLSPPWAVRITPGTSERASVNFCVGSGKVSNCWLLTVALGVTLSVLASALASPCTSTRAFTAMMLRTMSSTTV